MYSRNSSDIAADYCKAAGLVPLKLECIVNNIFFNSSDAKRPRNSRIRLLALNRLFQKCWPVRRLESSVGCQISRQRSSVYSFEVGQSSRFLQRNLCGPSRRCLCRRPDQGLPGSKSDTDGARDRELVWELRRHGHGPSHGVSIARQTWTSFSSGLFAIAK